MSYRTRSAILGNVLSTYRPCWEFSRPFPSSVLPPLRSSNLEGHPECYSFHPQIWCYFYEVSHFNSFFFFWTQKSLWDLSIWISTCTVTGLWDEVQINHIKSCGTVRWFHLSIPPWSNDCWDNDKNIHKEVCKSEARAETNWNIYSQTNVFQRRASELLSKTCHHRLPQI